MWWHLSVSAGSRTRGLALPSSLWTETNWGRTFWPASVRVCGSAIGKYSTQRLAPWFQDVTECLWIRQSRSARHEILPVFGLRRFIAGVGRIAIPDLLWDRALRTHADPGTKASRIYWETCCARSLSSARLALGTLTVAIGSPFCPVAYSLHPNWGGSCVRCVRTVSTFISPSGIED